MSDSARPDYADFRFILYALASWVICAGITSTAASAAVCKAAFPESSIAYISSAISFLCAFSAGASAARKRRSPLLYALGVCAGAITVLLLTVGFAVDADSIKPDGVLSVVSFTIAGVFSGGLLFGAIPAKKRRNKFQLT